MRPTRTAPVLVTRSRRPAPAPALAAGLATGLAAALAVVAVLLSVLSPPALADEAVGSRKPEHHAKYDVRRVTSTDYDFFGTVDTYPGGDLVVLRKRDGADRYTAWKLVKIRKTGVFRTHLTGARGDCFRMRIPATDDHRTTVADLGCIVA